MRIREIRNNHLTDATCRVLCIAFLMQAHAQALYCHERTSISIDFQRRTCQGERTRKKKLVSCRQSLKEILLTHVIGGWQSLRQTGATIERRFGRKETIVIIDHDDICWA
ncbi:hypothetical protein BJ166DRAFT_513161 [Pestalotiopsis sp. NC0098]|nr:hypothetical protein BJ166DRAFT_513161 [Pestalotiopsis sp. NC0098]